MNQLRDLAEHLHRCGASEDQATAIVEGIAQTIAPVLQTITTDVPIRFADTSHVHIRIVIQDGRICQWEHLPSRELSETDLKVLARAHQARKP